MGGTDPILVASVAVAAAAVGYIVGQKATANKTPPALPFTQQQQQQAPRPSAEEIKKSVASVHVRDLETEGAALAMLKGTTPTVFLVWSAGCGHCKVMMPAFNEAAARLSSQGVVFARVEFSTNKAAQVAKEIGLGGFPHLMGIGVDGGIRQYLEGRTMAGRTADSLVAFGESLKSPAPPAAPAPSAEDTSLVATSAGKPQAQGTQ